MKILFVANQVPFPPDNGVRIVTHHAMRLMKEAGHELALAVLTEESDAPGERFVAAAQMCRKDMAWWMPLPKRSRLAVQLLASRRGDPHFVERYRCEAFRLRLERQISEFAPDVIHFDIITLAQYVSAAPAGVGTVASINDSNALTLENSLASGTYRGLTRLYRERQLLHVRGYEGSEYSRFGAVHLMSEIDAAYLKRLNPDINAVVISNGVDQSLFAVGCHTRDCSDLIFVAPLVADNLNGLRAFLDESWPLIERAYPDVRLHVVGRIGAQAQALRSKHAGRRNVVFHGYVDKLSEVYRQCGIAIVPIDKNCGIINKVIEAMAAGAAVVGFEKTFAGLSEAKRGRDFVSAANYSEFAQVTLELIRDASRRRAVQTAGHDLARRHYTWSTRGTQYESMYRLSAERAKAGVPRAGLAPHLMASTE